MPKERQISFASGEMSPTLWGRTDLQQYASGARTIKNFVVTPHGVLKNRTGTQHIESLATTKARVYPFIYAEDDTSIIVFSDQVIQVLERSSGQIRYEFSSLTDVQGSRGNSYDGDDLASLQFAQVGNYLYIVHPNYPARRIVRYNSGNTYRLEAIALAPPPGPDNSSVAFDLYTALSGFDILEFVPETFESNEQWNGSQSFSEEIDGDSLFRAHAVIATDVRGGETFVDLSTGDEFIQVPFPTAIDAADEDTVADTDILWRWKYSYVVEDVDGSAYETQAEDVTFATVGDLKADTASGIYYAVTWRNVYLNGGLPVRSDRRLVFPYRKDDTFDLKDVNGTDLGTVTILHTRVYRGLEGRFGFIGSTEGTLFLDTGEEPDFERPPKGETELFDSADNYPSAIAFFEGRLVLAGTNNEPNKFWASATDRWRTFQQPPVPNDDDPLNALLASNKQEYIRSMVPRQKLLMLTSSAQWTLAGSGQLEVVTPNSIAARQVSQHGANKLIPLEVGPNIFFMPPKGTVPRAMLFDRGTVQTFDVSLMARHLFDGYSIVDWDYAEDPYSVVWMVRSDGVLLSLTYIPEQNMLAWAKHYASDDGDFTSVAVVPEGTEDGVYVTIDYDSATRNRVFLERFAPANLPRDVNDALDVRYSVHLDRAVTKNNIQDDGETIAITLLNEDFTGVFRDESGSEISFTEDTTDFADAGHDDVYIFTPDGPPQAIYFGAPSKFYKMTVDNASGTGGSGGYTTTWEYWDGSAWVELENVTDGTILDGEVESFSANTDDQEVSFPIPDDWQPKQLATDGTVSAATPRYYIRARFTGGSGVTAPNYDQGRIIREGRIGEIVQVVFSAGAGAAVGRKVMLRHPSGGLDTVLKITELVSGTTFKAEVLQAEASAADGTGVAVVPSAHLNTTISTEYEWGFPITSLSGLQHLQGEEVKILADGIVVEGVSVSAGGALLPFPALIATAGLSYNSDFESLDAEQERTREKIIKAITYEVEYSRGGKVGTELGDDMRELRGRAVEHNYGLQPSERREEKLQLAGKWQKSGRIAIRQSDPLPFTILGFTRHVEYGGE